MLSKARKWASISVGALFWGERGWTFFLGVFLLEEFLLVFLETCKMPLDEYLSP